MADLEDLGFLSITDMANDEALETLRQIRLSRRIPVKKTRTSSKKKKTKQTVSADQAAEILKILGGS